MTFKNRRQQAAVMMKLRRKKRFRPLVRRHARKHSTEAREFSKKVLEHKRFKSLPPDRRTEAKKAMDDLRRTTTQEEALFIIKRNRKLIREVVTDLALVGVPVWITPVQNIPKLRKETKELIRTEKEQFNRLRKKGFTGQEAVLIIKDREIRSER